MFDAVSYSFIYCNIKLHDLTIGTNFVDQCHVILEWFTSIEQLFVLPRIQVDHIRCPFIVSRFSRNSIRICPRRFAPDPFTVPQTRSPHVFPSSKYSPDVARSFSSNSGFCENFARTMSRMTPTLTSSQSSRRLTLRPVF